MAPKGIEAEAPHYSSGVSSGIDALRGAKKPFVIDWKPGDRSGAVAAAVELAAGSHAEIFVKKDKPAEMAVASHRPQHPQRRSGLHRPSNVVDRPNRKGDELRAPKHFARNCSKQNATHSIPS